MINVTKTYLPPLEEYVKYLKGIWGRCHITNNGPLVLELEAKLKEYLGVKHVFFVANGTMALQIVIKALGLSHEIVTTPFSYVATTSSVVWEGCNPVFADIDPQTLTINPRKIEAAITPRTEAILATHVYGNPCDVDAIEAIAKKHAIKVIYDAAHAFGVRYKGKSLMSYGDVSTLSLHATKIFHTVEGGAVITNSDEVAHKISYMRNFGHKSSEDFWGVGINGKNSELHAAMGLCILPKLQSLINKRKAISGLYDYYLKGLPGVVRPRMRPGTDYNYSYYPVILPSEELLLKFRSTLQDKGIFPRRYFYPSLDTLNYVKGSCQTNSRKVAKKVLCLPLYPGLPKKDIVRIASILKIVLKSND